MWNRRSRRRGAGRSSQLLYYVLVSGLILAAVGVLAVSVIPSLAFSTVGLDRPGNIGVVDDSNGIVGLDINSPITAGTQQRLVTVTNNLDTEADISVSLNDGSQGTLYYDGNSVGDSHTVDDVAAGDSIQFDIIGEMSGSDDWRSSPCSEAEESVVTEEGWNVTFYCVSYDSSEDETTYKYSVIPESSPPHDLSHVVFGFEDGFDPDIESTSPEAETEDDEDEDEDDDGEDDEGEVKTDPVTGVYGLKFETEVSKTGSGQTYNITVEGDHGTTSEDHGLKFGPKTETVNLPGPTAPSDSSSDGETVGFTVTSASIELMATLDRTTSMEAGATPTPEPESDEEDGDDEEDDEGDGEGSPPDDAGPPDDDDEEDEEDGEEEDEEEDGGGGPPDNAGPPDEEEDDEDDEEDDEEEEGDDD